MRTVRAMFTTDWGTQENLIGILKMFHILYGIIEYLVVPITGFTLKACKITGFPQKICILYDRYAKT